MHWNSIKTLKLSPRSLNVPCCYIRISFFRDIPHSLLYGKKGKSPTVLKQRNISYRLLLILLPLWVKVSHRHYQYFNAIHPIVFLEIYGALLIKKEIFCRFWALIIIEDVFNIVPSVRGSHVYKSPLDDTTYEAFPVSCTPAGGARPGAGPSRATVIQAMQMLCRGAVAMSEARTSHTLSPRRSL